MLEPAQQSVAVAVERRKMPPAPPGNSIASLSGCDRAIEQEANGTVQIVSCRNVRFFCKDQSLPFTLRMDRCSDCSVAGATLLQARPSLLTPAA